jgi:hypothetical protein
MKYFLTTAIVSVLFLYPASASAIQCAPPPTVLDYAFCQDADLRSMVEEGERIMQNIWPRVTAVQQQRLRQDQPAWRERTISACGLRAWAGIILPEMAACLRREVSARNQMLSSSAIAAPVAPAERMPANISVPVIPAPEKPAPVNPAPFTSGSPFDAGLANRRAYEEWFASLTGDFKRGAEYWAGQRSLTKPGSAGQQCNRTHQSGLLHLKIKINWLAAVRKTWLSAVFGDRTS